MRARADFSELMYDVVCALQKNVQTDRTQQFIRQYHRVVQQAASQALATIVRPS
jgi:hypothetical protein